MGWLIFIAAVVFIFYLLGRSESREQGRTQISRTSSYGRPPRSSRKSSKETVEESEAAWIPPGESVTVSDRTIPGGMIYVGEIMDSVRGYSNDPALIDPGLRVSQGGTRLDLQGRGLSYWPTYSEISPLCRATYLEWLSLGRRRPGYDIGYVFLFFYGLERRVLFDARLRESAKEDLPVIESEVEALLDVYGENRSFREYAGQLLDVLRLTTKGLNTDTYEPPISTDSYELPLGLKLGLGALIQEGEPIPPRWALSWVRCHPYTNWRTPGRRCAEEFNELFQIRYAERYGDGLEVRPPKSRLSLEYRPASRSFQGPVTLEGADVPDVGRLKAPLRKLQELVDEVQDALDSYSRYVGRYEDRTSPEALANLPADLVTKDRLAGDAEELVAAIEEQLVDSDRGFVPLSVLIRWWPTKATSKITKNEARDLADFLESVGFGIEPDPRFGSPNPGQSSRAVIYRLDGERGDPGETYRAATVLLHLGAALAAADDKVTPQEEEHLERHLEQGLELSGRDRLRLRAHLEWLLAEPPNLRGVRRRVRPLDEETRRRMARLLIAIAGADGRVSGGEVEILGKLYPILGLSEDDVYKDLHLLTAGEARGPVTVLQPEKGTSDFPVPKRRSEAAPGRSEGFRLDTKKLEAIRHDSARAGRLLEEIFRDEAKEGPFHGDEARSHDEEELPSQEGTTQSPAGLDPSHASLLLALRERRCWKWAQFESLSEQNGLLARGAIEILNEAAFEICGEPLLEGESEVDVNPYALEAMLE